MFRAGFIAVVLLDACGDQEQFIIVNVYMDTPALITVNTNGEWRTPQSTGPQQYGFGADGDYRFVAACDNEDGTFFVGEIVGRPDPEILGWNITPLSTSTSPGCSHFGGPEGVYVDVAGTISENAELTAYGGRTESAPNPQTWDYSMSVEAGVHDLLASNADASNTPHVVRRRGVDMRTSTVQPPIDLAGESLPMIENDFQVDGLPSGASANTGVELYLPDLTSARVSNRYDTSSFTVIDPTSLDAEDEQDLRIDVSVPMTLDSLSAVARLAPDLGPIELPQTVSAAYHEARDGLIVHWGPLPDYSYLEMQLADQMGDSSVVVIAQHDYATARGELTFEAPPDFPARWTPSWTHQLVDSYRTFEVSSNDASWYYTSSVFSENDDKSDATVRQWKSPGRRLRSSLTP